MLDFLYPFGYNHRMLIVKTDEYEKWYCKLGDGGARVRINVRLRRISENDYFGDCRSVGGGVYELRIDYGPGYRVYYGQSGQRIILLLIGGDKSTQQSDIKKAGEIWKANS